MRLLRRTSYRIEAAWVRRHIRVIEGRHGWIAFYRDRSASTNISRDHARAMLESALGVEK